MFVPQAEGTNKMKAHQEGNIKPPLSKYYECLFTLFY